MPGTHRRIKGAKVTPQSAYEFGYRFAIVSPKGHPVSYHMTEKTAGSGFYSLRKAGCRMATLEELLT